MSVIHNDLLLAGDDAYNLNRSLRFRSSASAYLSRTFGTPTNNKIYTFSFWVKRGLLNSRCDFITDNNTGSISTIGFQSDSLVLQVGNGSTSYYIISSAVYRDPSAWYHIVGVVDTTQATDSNRLKMYVNGVQVTSLQATVYPTQNFNPTFNSASSVGNIARYNGGGYLDGYLTEFNFIDGQALTPSSFGATNAQTGVWQPKKYAGTYGTNGFYLPFTDNSALTSGSNAGLGKDFSGNGNYWNTNNISITSGSTYDSMTDVPTLTSATASNFCTLNPLDQSNTTLSEANLKCVISTSGNRSVCGTMAVFNTGKYYWEVTPTNVTATHIGITRASAYAPLYSNGVNYYMGDGNKYIDGTVTSYGASWTNNDVIGIALNLDAGTVTFYKNNTSQGAITLPSVSSGDGWKPFIFNGTGSASQTLVANFGQRPFAYTPPTGYVALNTYNLPTPTIGATASTLANKYMDATTYTGNGSSGKTVSNSGSFSPDFVWVKDRTSANYHGLFDRLRGAGYALYSNGTFAESAFNAQTLQSFDSGGFTVGTNGDFNTNNNSYVGWQWKANGSGSSNTSGSITSTVSANTSAGFSVVTYTGNATGSTVGHGLGVAPKMLIVKQRNAGGNYFNVWFSGVTSVNQSLWLGSTDGLKSTAGYWNSTAPTSTVFSVGNDSGTNGSGSTYVAYCFSEVAGYSKFGSYTGNGSSDGTFVYLGFRPKFILIKRTDTSGENWVLYDSVRSTYNYADDYLLPNSSSAEQTYFDDAIDMVSNGMKIRASGSRTALNANGATYIFMAVAENPFKYSLAR